MANLPPDQPFTMLEAKGAFAKLTDKEKQYAHYMSRASFYAGLIVLLQVPAQPSLGFSLGQPWGENESVLIEWHVSGDIHTHDPVPTYIFIETMYMCKTHTALFT
jgi:hypothetical protein